MLGNGNGTFKAQSTFSVRTDPRFVTLGDVNGDGNLDLFTANYGSNNSSFLLGNGNGTFRSQTLLPLGSGPESVKLGDINGDGIIDNFGEEVMIKFVEFMFEYFMFGDEFGNDVEMDGLLETFGMFFVSKWERE